MITEEQLKNKQEEIERKKKLLELARKQEEIQKEDAKISQLLKEHEFRNKHSGLYSFASKTSNGLRKVGSSIVGLIKGSGRVLQKVGEHGDKINVQLTEAEKKEMEKNKVKLQQKEIKKPVKTTREEAEDVLSLVD